MSFFRCRGYSQNLHFCAYVLVPTLGAASAPGDAVLPVTFGKRSSFPFALLKEKVPRVCLLLTQHPGVFILL